jgi:superfamily II DNA/RNA helicase
MLFSATLDRRRHPGPRYLTNPVTHSVDSADVTPPDMTHHAFTVTADDKAAVVRELASGKGAACCSCAPSTRPRSWPSSSPSGIPPSTCTATCPRAQRDRNLAAFSDGSVRVLVATDIAARGIHVDDIALVVHVDPPTEHKAYLHRSGRTARAGAKGTSSR